MQIGTDLEDLLQEVALVFVSRVGELRNVDALRPWLRTVAINRARSAGRRMRLRESAPEPLPVDCVRSEVGTDEGTADRLRQVLEMTRKLPVKYAEPLLLKALDGLSQHEIAETLELSEAAVETRLARARRMLRERMARATDVLGCSGRAQDGGQR
jgi:RNA polymerase sigma-70 factor (ECF subfamily)